MLDFTKISKAKTDYETAQQELIDYLNKILESLDSNNIKIVEENTDYQLHKFILKDDIIQFSCRVAN